MNENMKEMGMNAPYFPEETEDDEVLEQREMDVKDTEDEVLGEQVYISYDDSYAVGAEKEFSVIAEEYLDAEEEYAVLPAEETDDYEFMPDINFDIYTVA